MKINEFEARLKKEVSRCKSSYNKVKDITFSSINNYQKLDLKIWFYNSVEINVIISYDNMNLKNKVSINYDFYKISASGIEDIIDIELSGILTKINKEYKLYLQKNGKQFLE